MEIKDAVKILSSRNAIAAPGKYRVRVSNCSPFSKVLEGGQTIVAIANFNGMSPYHVEQAKELLNEGDITKALNQNFSLSIRANDYKPTKGEVVDIIVDLVDTKSGDKALLVTGLSPVAAITTMAKADFSAFAGADFEEPEAEEGDLATKAKGAKAA